MAGARDKKRGRADRQDLTALLHKWDFQDASDALAEGGWKSVLRLKRTKTEDGLPKWTMRVLEAMLQEKDPGACAGGECYPCARRKNNPLHCAASSGSVAACRELIDRTEGRRQRAG